MSAMIQSLLAHIHAERVVHTHLDGIPWAHMFSAVRNIWVANQTFLGEEWNS